MTTVSITLLVWFGALGCGIMAGIYFAFSTFIMSSLAKIETNSGIAAMQSINRVILRSPFMPLFWGTSIASLAVIFLAINLLDGTASFLAITAGATYTVGMLLCTVFLNVPLNNKLDAVEPESDQGKEVWEHYLKNWSRWNHIRTVSCALSSGLYMGATFTV